MRLKKKNFSMLPLLKPFKHYFTINTHFFTVQKHDVSGSFKRPLKTCTKGNWVIAICLLAIISTSARWPRKIWELDIFDILERPYSFPILFLWINSKLISMKSLLFFLPLSLYNPNFPRLFPIKARSTTTKHWEGWVKVSSNSFHSYS